ncbi:MAG TPA: 4Fe-4S binding protein [Kiloniellales bacterium]
MSPEQRNPAWGGRLARRIVVAAAVAAFASLPQADRAAAQEAPGHSLPESRMRQAFPGGEAFGPLEGAPPAAAVYREGQLAGYVFSSRQTVQSTGYSAKPLDVVVGLDLGGAITGVAIAEHHEPILVIGVTDEDLDAFVAQYSGLDIRDPIRLSPSRRDAGGLDAVSGATISSLVMNDAILRSARAVAVSRGILGGSASGLRFDEFAPATWADLVEDGSLAALTITTGQARRAIEALGGRLLPEGVPLPPDEASFLDLYAGLATPARVGRNLLGERAFARLMAEGEAGDQLLFVAGQGLYSFKGYAYRRSGTFDRLQLIQGNRTFRFARQDYRSFETVAPSDAPAMREIAVFAIAGETGFDPARPWRLQVLVEGEEDAGMTPMALFELSYRPPQRYLAPPEDAAGADAPLWLRNWRDRGGEIAVLGVGLTVLTLILVFQDALTRRRRLYLVLRIGFLTYTLLWIGWIAGAQLSVVNVLTFADALITDFSWEFFLLEPLLFILWSYVAIALMFWGRGVFCGWLCPFGALQELIARLGRRLHVPEWRLPFGLHERLWPVKYIAFLALFALFLYDPVAAVKGAEIEPFKTAIVLKFDRAWPFGLYAGLLLLAGLFVNRFYCRYLCPLGGALALPARVRMFEWLKRRWQCGTPCQICARTCPVQAIHPEGKINPNECIHCLNCQVNYYDADLCPPLLDRRKRRERAQRSAPSIRDPDREGTGAEA